MADRLELAFRRHGLPLIPRGSAVLAAVSGGGDSVALLHLLAGASRGRELSIGVAHLDHGLRRGSRADRRWVEGLARELALPLHADRRDVAAKRRKKESPEEAARRVRREFLLEIAESNGYELIATGHNLDDQAETILMRLARGAGATGLSGMSPAGPGPFVRPLLQLEREELREYLRRRDIGWREDPSNLDLRFDRNKLRRRVLPLLASSLNPRVAHHLVKAARLLREDAEHLDTLARDELEGLSRSDRLGRLVVDARELAKLAPPIAQRVARFALVRAGVDARRLATRHVEALLDLARGGRGRQIDLPGGVLVLREARQLRIGR
jgi:tRNA(Ile)-lysidine synthase